ncbi:MAG: amino acid adenylation domain-containing protein [Actinomycetia bacterium]|nr:amino acid adenylation domain-containing protein [Actinomycetes bacterium]
MPLRQDEDGDGMVVAVIDTDLQAGLAAEMARVLGIDSVPPESNFFEDLGADSMLLMHFCARLGKRTDLPSPSIRDVYQNPTISSLARAFGAAESPPDVDSPAVEDVGAGDLGPAMWSHKRLPAPRANRRQYVTCALLQLAFMAAGTLLAALVLSRGFVWISEASGIVDTYLRAAVYGAVLFVALSVFPILVKWALVGRSKPGQVPLWSLGYVRFWVVRSIVGSSPMRVFAGTPLYVLYLKTLGARIGRGTVILSTHVPVCADLLTIGENVVIRKDSAFSCYRAFAGYIQMGTVHIGDNAFVGEQTVLDIDTSIEDNAQVGHASALYRGQSVPAGQRRVGTPALQTTDVDYMAVGAGGHPGLRRISYSALQTTVMFLVSSPIAISIATAIFEWRVVAARVETAPAPGTQGSFYVGVLLLALALFAISTVVRFVLVMTVPRLLNLAIQPGTAYPLYGFRYWCHRGVGRFSNAKFFTKLMGDSSYIVHYLHLLGYDVSFEEQTGANFGMHVKHDNPFAVSVGAGTMAADGLSIINTEYSSTAFRVDRAAIGAHCFIGNEVVYPSQGTTSENCLHASKVMVPIEGDERGDVGYLGSPAFEIPRVVFRDKQFDDLKDEETLPLLLRAKNRHNLKTMGWYLLSRFVALFGAVAIVLGGADLYPDLGMWSFALVPVVVFAAGSAYSVLLERWSIGFRRLEPMYCSIYDKESWKIERYWKMSWYPTVLNGTPFKAMFWRMLGARVGRRLYDDGGTMTEKTMVTIGDDCVLNAGSLIQPHSQEDGSFKSDHIRIGSGCTVGVAALVHYGVTMGDGSSLAPNSFLMKGAEVPAHTNWGENPARELVNQHSDRTLQRRNLVDKPTDDAEEFWRNILGAGGLNPVPRWGAGAEAGVAGSGLFLPDGLAERLHAATEALQLSATSILLAAHAKVLAALTGEQSVMTGYVPAADVETGPLPCPLVVSGGSWRTVLENAGRAETMLLARRRFPVAGLYPEFGLSKPPFETILDAGEGEATLDADTVFSVAAVERDGRPALVLRYRTDLLDEAASKRILGYHLTALDQATADVEADHERQSLLSAAELDFQVEGLAGPRREIPDGGFHELFEQRVRRHPDSVAAVQDERCWTYRELNARANRLGRALLARGLEREGVVAVVTERNLDWMAAVLAVFKAGGVYLPIEPHFPADRVTATLARAGCRIAITEHTSDESLKSAVDTIGDIDLMYVGDVWNASHPDRNLGLAVAPDQLAYIYFTSGSTGEPKGAMCEHAGFLNHLYAKIDDFEMVEGEVVAQIAPQCFDISLWQLVSALLVGGTTVVVEQETLLDPGRFIATIVDERVGVMQVVPSYLEVLLSYLEQNPRDLVDLHCVSATGEALKPDLVHRWFAAQPHIKLANAYGLTETSDDTNHEVMTKPPSDGTVPLGRSVNNAYVYVVDENLLPVPLGAPGEIVFSGVCVGRGYINDPERTALAYLDDPLRPGERLYRSGDFGRWRPDGKLEYLGRRDAQVKIRGFRIEIGEIENSMRRIDGVREGAVVLSERPDGNKQLVAFYSGEEYDRDQLKGRMGQVLPDYMVPSVIERCERLPLTANGKVDRKMLTALAGGLFDERGEIESPITPAEIRIAAAWAKALNLPTDQIGRGDDFFDRGGTSLSAVELVIELGDDLSLKDVTRHPVLSDMALLAGGEKKSSAGLLQQLSNHNDVGAGMLVCFPHAGGNAINAHAMARALSDNPMAVYAVELPGHDPTIGGEPFAPLPDIVERVVAEVVELAPTSVAIWGHSSGTAFAVDTARTLEARGVSVSKVFLAAQLPGDLAGRQAHVAKLRGQSDTEIAQHLMSDRSDFEIADLDASHTEQIGAAYRHDCLAAHEFFIAAAKSPPARYLSAPVVAIVADDDPATDGWRERYLEWRMLVDNIEVVALSDGGHFLLRTRPEEVAAVVERALAGQTIVSEPSTGPVRLSPGATASHLEIVEQPNRPPMVLAEGVGDPLLWVAANRDDLRGAVLEHGSLAVRGLGLGAKDLAIDVVTALADQMAVDREAFAGRDRYRDGIYSSSNWPATQQMCMHHELSYRVEVPGMMMFVCLAPSTTGGSIPLASAAAMLSKLPTEVVDRFDREGWMLTRSFTDEIGLSAQEAFGIEERSGIDSYCMANSIEFEWQPDGGLLTRQCRPAVVNHPITRQRCWFNQIAFLSEWTMKKEVREFMIDVYGEDGLPFNTRFGNGDPIGEDVVKAINDAYDAITVEEPMQAGDLLLVDNIGTAHSREPYEGGRDVLVAMTDPVRLVL